MSMTGLRPNRSEEPGTRKATAIEATPNEDMIQLMCRWSKPRTWMRYSGVNVKSTRGRPPAESRSQCTAASSGRPHAASNPPRFGLQARRGHRHGGLAHQRGDQERHDDARQRRREKMRCASRIARHPHDDQRTQGVREQIGAEVLRDALRQAAALMRHLRRDQRLRDRHDAALGDAHQAAAPRAARRIRMQSPTTPTPWRTPRWRPPAWACGGRTGPPGFPCTSPAMAQLKEKADGDVADLEVAEVQVRLDERRQIAEDIAIEEHDAEIRTQQSHQQPLVAAH